MSLLGKVAQPKPAITAVNARNAEKPYVDLTDNFALAVVLENSSTRMMQN